MGLSCAWCEANGQAARLAVELTAQHDFDCSVSAAEAKMEITAKARPFIKAEAIRINTKTAIEIKAGSGIETGSTSAAKLTFSEDSNSRHRRSTSSSS